MITIEQAKVIGAVLKRFNDSEILPWTEVDDAMEYLSWLSDAELAMETKMLLDKHAQGNARCIQKHPPEQCFVPVVLSAVSYILDDFEQSRRLAKKARYVMEYYMSISASGDILTD